MRYQEKIYIQNENRAVRNKDILNVNMSSDFCVFQSPTFNVSNTTKVQCDSITCNLSGISFSNIASAVTYTCIGTGSTECVSLVTWETKIYSNGDLAYNEMFYTGATVTGTPSEVQFLATVSRGFNDLQYSYTKDNTLFTIDKPYGIKTLEIDLCVSIYGLGKGFACPIGFSATPANDACQKIITTAATFNGSGTTIIAGNKNVNYNKFGAYFYGNIQNNQALPIYFNGASLYPSDQTGGTINALAINNSSSFWSSLSLSGNGRLNNVGLSASSTEFLGFSYCLDIDVAGTYYIGLAADNRCRFKVDGTLLVNYSGVTTTNFDVWSVYPYNFTSGRHVIEMEGINDGSDSSFGAEIYNPINFATLTGATNTASTQANVIFSTVDYIGKKWELGSTIGYSCPTGYVLNGCGSAYTCTKIITTAKTETCTGECLDNCVIVCDDTFPYIDNTSQGVFIVNPLLTTSIPVTFNFTGNTSTFTSDTTFKYEVYSYLKNSQIFKLPATYKSSSVSYSAFSGTNIISQSIPLSGLNLDGEYIVKGYFEANACTNFLSRLGKKINTSEYTAGQEYGIYVPSTDYYFVAITKADTPYFDNALNPQQTYLPVTLTQQVIFVDLSNESNTSTLYGRTGSTFVLTNEYAGDVLVTLNGLTMAKNIDYSLSGQILTFYGTIINEDIISIFYTKILSSTLIGDSILIDTVIPSGATNTQGNNKYFYNITTAKYEVYTNNKPLTNTKIMVMLNGMTLADGIDYYQSTSNTNRVILTGILYVGDIVTIVYYPMATVINNTNQTNNYIAWYISNEPQLKNGEFALQYSTNNNFSTFITADIVSYDVNVTSYYSILSLSGNVGTKYYYRVKNTKNYESICGDKIETIAYSETVPIIIQSNAINSY